MQGPRGAFSSTQLSPVEALGIHASTPAEQAKYARLFSEILYEDTKRVAAWSNVGQAEVDKITVNDYVLNFDAAPKASVSFESADILGVPRTSVVPPAKAKRPAAPPKALVPPKSLGRASSPQSSVESRGAR